MIACRFAFALLVQIIIGSNLCLAFERSDGQHVHCEIERNGKTHQVREIWLGHGDAGDRHPELGGAAAIVRHDAQGWPLIYF